MNWARKYSREEFLALAFQQSWAADLAEPHPLEDGERVLADHILGLALTEDLRPENVQLLKAIYEGLVSKESAWRLTIKRARPGRWRSREKLLIERGSDLTTLLLIEHLTKKLGKREAAVAVIAERHEMTRDQVFAAMRRGREWRNKLKQKS